EPLGGRTLHQQMRGTEQDREQQYQPRIDRAEEAAHQHQRVEAFLHQRTPLAAACTGRICAGAGGAACGAPAASLSTPSVLSTPSASSAAGASASRWSR